jgi:hypothetical protein
MMVYRPYGLTNAKVKGIDHGFGSNEGNISKLNEMIYLVSAIKSNIAF